MQTSSFTRRKAAFVPWLAAMVLAATAHLGWLIHELRERERGSSPAVHVEIDARTIVAPTLAAPPEPARFVLTLDCDALADAGFADPRAVGFEASARELGLDPARVGEPATVAYACQGPGADPDARAVVDSAARSSRVLEARRACRVAARAEVRARAR